MSYIHDFYLTIPCLTGTVDVLVMTTQSIAQYIKDTGNFKHF